MAKTKFCSNAEGGCGSDSVELDTTAHEPLEGVTNTSIMELS